MASEFDHFADQPGETSGVPGPEGESLRRDAFGQVPETGPTTDSGNVRMSSKDGLHVSDEPSDLDEFERRSQELRRAVASRTSGEKPDRPREPRVAGGTPFGYEAGRDFGRPPHPAIPEPYQERDTSNFSAKEHRELAPTEAKRTERELSKSVEE